MALLGVPVHHPLARSHNGWPERPVPDHLPYQIGQSQEPSFDGHNSNGKLRYSWAVDLEAIK